MSAEESSAQVLRQFMQEMNLWERDCFAKSRATRGQAGQSQAVHQSNLAAMNAIFAKYCTARQRPHGRQGSFQHPPEYDPEAEMIMEVSVVSPSRVLIRTQQSGGLRSRCEYMIVKQGGRWLIDNKKIVRADGSKISNAL